MGMSATSIDPWLGALVGAIGGAAQLKQNQINNPGAPSNFLGLASGIANGYLSAASARASQSRDTQDALAAIALQSGLTPEQVMERLSYQGADGKTAYLTPKEYHADVGKQLGQGMGNVGLADSLGVANPGTLFGLDPSTATNVFGAAGKALQNQASIPAVAAGLNQGNAMAGGVGTPFDPMMGVRGLPSTNSLIPGAAGALGMGGMFPGAVGGNGTAAQLPRTPFLGIQPPAPEPVPNGLDLSYRDEVTPGLLSGSVEGEGTNTGETLRNLFLNSPDPSEYRLAADVGGSNANRLNTQRVSLFNNTLQEETKRENNALGAVVDKQKADSYDKQVDSLKNAFQALQSDDPNVREAARVNLTKTGGVNKLDPAKVYEELQTAGFNGGREGLKATAQNIVDRNPDLTGVVNAAMQVEWERIARREGARGQSPSANKTPGSSKQSSKAIKTRRPGGFVGRFMPGKDEF